jgi:hypothetical protein
VAGTSECVLIVSAAVAYVYVAVLCGRLLRKRRRQQERKEEEMETVMEEPKFTPGPWQKVDKFTVQAQHANVVHHGRGYLRLPCPDTKSEEECESNAHLIASAPALYDELLALVRLIEWPFDRQAKKDEAIKEACLRARSALSKANGGS